MRTIGLAVTLASALALTACDNGPAEPDTVTVALDEPDAAVAAAPAAPVKDYGAIPMADRVAVIGLLNKRNNVTQDVTLKPGENREVGPVIIRLSACERTAPWELPQEVGAFVQVDVQERGQRQHRRVFSGWLFRESPSLNVVEHPVYDVWIKDCTMAFPGEEGSAAPAAEAAGRPAPRRAASPAATPSPARAPVPALAPGA